MKLVTDNCRYLCDAACWWMIELSECVRSEMLLAKKQTSQAVEAMRELGDFLYNIGNVK